MAIALTNNIAPADAPFGTVVGVLTESRGVVTSFNLLSNPHGLFSISGDNLITAWDGTATSGGYSVWVLALGPSILFDIGIFTITITPPKAATIGLDLGNVVINPQSTPTKSGP